MTMTDRRKEMDVLLESLRKELALPPSPRDNKVRARAGANGRRFVLANHYAGNWGREEAIAALSMPAMAVLAVSGAAAMTVLGKMLGKGDSP